MQSSHVHIGQQAAAVPGGGAAGQSGEVRLQHTPYALEIGRSELSRHREDREYEWVCGKHS